LFQPKLVILVKNSEVVSIRNATKLIILFSKVSIFNGEAREYNILCNQWRIENSLEG
jgi:hypothetical protein